MVARRLSQYHQHALNVPSSVPPSTSSMHPKRALNRAFDMPPMHPQCALSALSQGMFIQQVLQQRLTVLIPPAPLTCCLFARHSETCYSFLHAVLGCDTMPLVPLHLIVGCPTPFMPITFLVLRVALGQTSLLAALGASSLDASLVARVKTPTHSCHHTPHSACHCHWTWHCIRCRHHYLFSSGEESRVLTYYYCKLY
jgi:hypothetical protein